MSYFLLVSLLISMFSGASHYADSRGHRSTVRENSYQNRAQQQRIRINTNHRPLCCNPGAPPPPERDL